MIMKFIFIDLVEQAEQAKKVYLLGFDLSIFGQPLNNIYKGTQNYLPANAIGFNPVNWVEQMQATFVEFRNVQFYWVDTKLKEKVQITPEEKSQDLDGPLNHLKSLKAEEQKLREKLSEVQKMKRTLKGKILKEVQG